MNLGSGQPLPEATRADFEARLAGDFSAVRVHHDSSAVQAAQQVQARAYTQGHHIVFDEGEYQPQSSQGRMLLAHELVHVMQHPQAQNVLSLPDAPHVSRRDDASEKEADSLARTASENRPTRMPQHAVAAGTLSRAPKAALAATVPPPLTSDTAADELRKIAQFLKEQQAAATQPAKGASAQGTNAAPVINQNMIRGALIIAWVGFNHFYNLPDTKDEQRVKLRSAFIEVLAEVRKTARLKLDSLTPSNAAAQQDYAETVASYMAVDPMTSAQLASTNTFTTADESQGQQYETELSAFLDDWLAELPKLQLEKTKQDELYHWLSIALRRSFVTIRKQNARSISDMTIMDKYQQVSAMLTQGTSPPQMSLITDKPPVTGLTQAEITAELNKHVVDLSNVPDDEQDVVRKGLAKVFKGPLSPGVTLKNAYWPLVLPVRTNVSVRYELVFDDKGDVRVERLGQDFPREVDTAFLRMKTEEKRAELIKLFGLAGVDDGTAKWNDSDLNQIRAAYALIPSAQLGALQGFTIVRDSKSPSAPTSEKRHQGLTHTGPQPTYDTPAPAHPPPHIHYFDEAFAQNDFAVTSAPGIGGPGGDWVLLHEVGHAEAKQGVEGAFAAWAGKFGFSPFTNYARTGVHEWFAETYALFVTDPTRLIEMNSKMFSWFKAGMPTDPKWTP